MIIQKVTDPTFASFIAESQVSMAKETEDYALSYDTVFKGVNSIIEDSNKGSYYICFIDGKPVACLLTVPEWSDWRNKTVLWIHSVYVIEEYRNQGVFKKLYTYLKDLVTETEELAGLRLYVDKRNVNALEVYHKLGMESSHYSLCEWLK